MLNLFHISEPEGNWILEVKISFRNGTNALRNIELATVGPNNWCDAYAEAIGRLRIERASHEHDTLACNNLTFVFSDNVKNAINVSAGS
jgi:hypothetical protein